MTQDLTTGKTMNPNRYPTENAARRAVIDACLKMNALGINQAKSGNISVRWQRGAKDGYLVTPTGLPYEETTEDDIVWLALDEDPEHPPPNPVLAVFPQAQVPRVDRPGRLPSSEWRMHAMIYREHAAQTAGAVVHTHSPYATSLACLPKIQSEGMPAFHYMIAVAGGNDIRCAAYETFGTEALSQAAARALAGRFACLLGNHGVLAYQKSLASALTLAHEVETLARMYWQAMQLGQPVILPDDEMSRVLAKFKTYGQPVNREEFRE